MTINVNSTVKVKEDLIYSKIDNEVVMMTPDHEDYLNLNGVGSVIWEKLSRAQRVEDIKRELLEQFEVSEDTCEQELIAFLNNLHDKKLIEVD
ncbi:MULTISPECIES: PqqD family peptide modification chaperone [Gammaproteobacteria]|uniref:PqqD family peptide modification chaperone n=1 Tax=Gammaproteobacteria TaxID=1236 RepID=UPI000DD0921B|nr:MULTISPECIES: PqqD family peptide modification chaperone [Gammaproteobacteria]RTE86085.1 PqqD family protein [Aliidiomarina sp. B3213]TCZ91439.1 PqqD family protein [Lysobacter sp. N42]